MAKKDIPNIDMPPDEIVIALRRKKIRQCQVARKLGVSDSAVRRVIYGFSVSHRIRLALAEATGIAVEQIWPSSYIYGPAPHERGIITGRKGVLKKTIKS